METENISKDVVEQELYTSFMLHQVVANGICPNFVDTLEVWQSEQAQLGWGEQVNH